MMSIECFKGLPLEYESFLVERYDSYVTNCRYYEIFHPTSDINYMLIHEDNHLIELIIFIKDGFTATCLNALVGINENIIKEFSRNIFEKYPAIQEIKIEASYTEYTFRRVVLSIRSHDFIINLPSTIDDYYQELGRTTRSHMRNYKNKLQRDYPGVNYITKVGDEINEETIDKIMRLNFERIKQKGEIPHKDHTYVSVLYKYTLNYGCVSYIEIDGLIVAGCIAIISNKSMSLLIISHDNNYSRYNVGQICMVYLIQISIERDLKTLHLLWGELEYKKRFLAKPHPMNSYVIYKTYSLHFIKSKIKEMISGIVYRFKRSKYSKPLRIISEILNRKSSEQLSKLEY